MTACTRHKCIWWMRRRCMGAGMVLGVIMHAQNILDSTHSACPRQSMCHHLRTCNLASHAGLTEQVCVAEAQLIELKHRTARPMPSANKCKTETSFDKTCTICVVNVRLLTKSTHRPLQHFDCEWSTIGAAGSPAIACDKARTLGRLVSVTRVTLTKRTGNLVCHAPEISNL